MFIFENRKATRPQGSDYFLLKVVSKITVKSSIVACGKFKGGCHKTTPYKIKPSIFNLGTLALVNFLIIWLLHVNFTPGWMNGMPVSEPLAFMLGAVTQLPELVRGVSHQLLAVICGSLGW